MRHSVASENEGDGVVHANAYSLRWSPIETYDDIQNTISSAAEMNAMYEKLFWEDPIKAVTFAPDFRTQTEFDVVTIRNRFWSGGSDLKSVLKGIEDLRGSPM